MSGTQEQEMNLIVVTAAEEFARRRGLKLSDALAQFRAHSVFKALREQYETLHTLDLDESADFAESLIGYVQ